MICRHQSNKSFARTIRSSTSARNAEGRSQEQTDPGARQNVIFEHGLLIGLLGQERTCALLLGEIEEPSDVREMMYEQISDVKGDALKIALVLRSECLNADLRTKGLSLLSRCPRKRSRPESRMGENDTRKSLGDYQGATLFGYQKPELAVQAL